MNRNKKDVCEVQEREMEEGKSGRNMQTAFMKITFEWLFFFFLSLEAQRLMHNRECPYSGNMPWPPTVRSVQHVMSLPVGTHPWACLHGRVLLPSFQ